MKQEMKVSEVQFEASSFFLLIVVTQNLYKIFRKKCKIFKSKVQETYSVSLIRE